MAQNAPFLPNSLSQEELRTQFTSLAVWKHWLDFSNGLSTAEFDRRNPDSGREIPSFLQT